MKKSILLLAAFFLTATANAQVSFDMSKYFTVPEKTIDLNEAMTVKDGIVFIGDTRTPDKITDGKYKGMRVQKQGRYYNIGGKAVKYANSLSFRRAPQGASKDHQVDITLVPRSCMIQLKPASDGQLSFCAITNKPEGNNLYVAVVNGNTFKVIATITYAKGDEDYARKKESPAEVKTCDYTYTAGDELWIYSDGGINLHAFTFSGKIDSSFAGTDPVAVAKAVRKAQK